MRAQSRTANLIYLFSLFCGNAMALEPEAIFERVSPSVWLVRTLDAQEKPIALGSAVVIAPGKLVTNCHVLAKSRFIQVRKDNVSYAATLEFPDPERDLCQISVRNFTAPAVMSGSMQNLKIGQRVYAIGNPRGLELTMSEGIISSLRGGRDGSPLIQTTAAISQGSSGGGLFDNEGRLIGITTFYAKDSQNLNFAHPIDWITDLPERGAAVLARRAASTPAAATAQPASAFPRTLVGEEFSGHIRRLRKVQTKLQGLDWIAFSSDGSLSAMGPSNQSPSGTLVPGNYRINSGNNTICITMVPLRAHNSFSAPSALSGCYNVIQTGERSYSLKSTSEEFIVPYDFSG